MPTVPFAKTGTAPEGDAWEWDTAAQNKILGDNGDDWTLYKAAHAWWDGSSGDDAAKKTPYKLPHHRMGSDGKLEAVWRGVTAAMGRLTQADIPDDELKATFDHLASHYSQWDKEPPEWDRFMEGVEHYRHGRELARQGVALPWGTTRASLSVATARPRGVPTEDDLGRINAMARSPLVDSQVYVFPSEISNQSVDAYYTQMSPLSLEQFARDATEGVAVCNSHIHAQLNMGRSYFGETVTVGRDGGNMMTTQALAYMLRGMALPTGLSTDDVIAGIEAGIYRDISIGFIPSHYWCNICGCDMMRDWDCMHWPGQQYETRDEGMMTCIAIVDARLGEYSLVYDGATPNAMLLKTERMLERGVATPRQLAFVEERTQVALRERWRGFTAMTAPTPTTTEEDIPMKGSELVAAFMERANKEISAANMTRLKEMCDTLSQGHDTIANGIEALSTFMAEKSADTVGDVPPGSDDDGDGDEDEPSRATPSAPTVRGKKAAGDEDETGDDDAGEEGDEPPANEDEDADKTEGKRGVTEPLTEAGTQRTPARVLSRHERDMIALGERARSDAIAATLAAGARAMGETFNAEHYQEMLRSASYDAILGIGRDFQQMARVALSPRGRFQTDNAAAGGGYWTEEPTLVGGRQTAARNPNDPQSTAGIRPSSGRRRTTTADVSLYKSGGR